MPNVGGSSATSTTVHSSTSSDWLSSCGSLASSRSSDPEKANGILGGLDSEIQETLDHLRDLAHGIYPPLLQDRGLADALAAAALRAPIAARVEARGLGRYPPDVEATVYFCCLEALQNAAKHAGDGAYVTIRVRADRRR